MKSHATPRYGERVFYSFFSFRTQWHKIFISDSIWMSCNATYRPTSDISSQSISLKRESRNFVKLLARTMLQRKPFSPKRLPQKRPKKKRRESKLFALPASSFVPEGRWWCYFIFFLTCIPIRPARRSGTPWGVGRPLRPWRRHRGGSELRARRPWGERRDV